MVMSKRTWWVCCIAVVEFAASQAFAATLHVNPSDPKAFKSIQKAIDAAKAFDEIIVHAGVDKAGAYRETIYKETINFKAKPITVRSVDPNDPNAVAKTIIDGSGASVVLFQNAETGLSVLRGLSVRNGKNGIDCVSDSRPLIRQCVIYANSASGIYGGSATIYECRIHTNGDHGIAYGEGLVCKCTITGNHAHGLSSFGGTIEDSTVTGNGSFGVYSHQGSASIARCLVSGNGGYGVYWLNAGTNGEVKNSIISGNGSSGIYVNGASGLVTNCTVVGNLLDGVQVQGGAKVTVGNSIIAWNKGCGITGTPPVTLVPASTYNDVFANQIANYGAGIVPGQGDIQEHPWFAVNGYWDKGCWYEGDYHLMSTVGRWGPDPNDPNKPPRWTWVKDSIDSPCIDAGDPGVSVGDEPAPNGGRINQGAYGGTAEASMSVGGLGCAEFPEMDFNHDCKVDQADLDIFMQHWLNCGEGDPNACWPQGPPAAPQVQP
jgi:hypothetical protein